MGCRSIAVLHHEQPAVSMRLLIRAGSAADPKAKTGLAHLTSALLDQGTTTQSASQFNDAIDFIGGAVSTGAGSDLSYANMVVMKDSFDSSLHMLSDMVRHPSFADAEIARQRQQLLSSLQVSFDDPDFIANAVFDRLVYGFHPYGLPQSGTPETLASITRADLVAFHQKYFVPNNAVLAIVGDVTAEDAFASVRRAFGDWERREVPVTSIVEPPTPARRVVVVDKPDAVQTEVRVGNIGIPRNHPDYMAVNLAIRILGGEGSNRLHQILRTARGLTYGAQADFDTYKESGDFQAETNTRTGATGEVLRLIVDEFWRLQRDRVSERELSDAKVYLTGSFPLTIETPNAIAMQILNVVFFGLPIEQLQTFRDRVNAVTVDDVQRVARLYLEARPAVGRSGGQCLGIHESAPGRRISDVRDRGHREPRSDGRRFQRRRASRGRAGAAVRCGPRRATLSVFAAVFGRLRRIRKRQGDSRSGSRSHGRAREASRRANSDGAANRHDAGTWRAGRCRSHQLHCVPESIPRRDEDSRGAADLGVRRIDGVDARSSGHARGARADGRRSEKQPPARRHPPAARRRGRIAPRQGAAGRPQRARPTRAHVGALEQHDGPDRPVD